MNREKKCQICDIEKKKNLNVNKNMDEKKWKNEIMNKPDDCLAFLKSEEDDDEVEKEVEPNGCLFCFLYELLLPLQLFEVILVIPFSSFSELCPFFVLVPNFINLGFDVDVVLEERSNKV